MKQEPALDTLERFLPRLKARREALQPADQLAHDDATHTLSYASALLRRFSLDPEAAGLPRQIAVIGPTQSGKSTIVNILLGAEAAVPSPLAGYTRNAQGFTASPVDQTLERGLERQFPGWRREQDISQETAAPKVYSLTGIEGSKALSRRPLIIWDTPDFDSISSRAYRDIVPEVCAMADLILLVVSREKYADQSVWRMLRLLAPIETPLLICLNKTDAAAAEILRCSIEERLASESIRCAAILSYPFLQGDDGPLEGEAARSLQDAVFRRLPPSPALPAPEKLGQLLLDHWTEWTGALHQEANAAATWQGEVGAGLQEALELYRRDYLQDPHYDETLKRAIVRLLELLELPGIAASLMQVRQVLTWPARKVRSLFSGPEGEAEKKGREQEIGVLNDALSHLLLQLQHRVGEHALADSGTAGLWWRNLLQQLERSRLSLERGFAGELVEYQERFEAEIDRAGEELFHYLEQHPVTLNSLRAARVTTDAAAVGIAIKTGGIGLNDLIFTPAMLSFTTMLAEGAVGHYMQTVEEALKERQLEAVRGELFDGVLKQRLLEMTRAMSRQGCYAIPGEELTEAEQALETLNSGRTRGNKDIAAD
jgi:GTPase SAR1 family protein